MNGRWLATWSALAAAFAAALALSGVIYRQMLAGQAGRIGTWNGCVSPTRSRRE